MRDAEGGEEGGEERGGGGGGGRGRKRGGKYTHRDGLGGDRGIAWWQNAHCGRREGVREGGSRSPRGRTRALATHTHALHARVSRGVAHARGVHTSLQYGRVHGCARACCSVGRRRVRVRVRARLPAS